LIGNAGAVVISHDRYFLDRVATHILAFEGILKDGKTERTQQREKKRDLLQPSLSGLCQHMLYITHTQKHTHSHMYHIAIDSIAESMYMSLALIRAHSSFYPPPLKWQARIASRFSGRATSNHTKRTKSTVLV